MMTKVCVCVCVCVCMCACVRVRVLDEKRDGASCPLKFLYRKPSLLRLTFVFHQSVDFFLNTSIQSFLCITFAKLEQANIFDTRYLKYDPRFQSVIQIVPGPIHKSSLQQTLSWLLQPRKNGLFMRLPNFFSKAYHKILGLSNFSRL